VSREAEGFALVALDPHPDGRGWVVNPFDGLPGGACISDCHAFSIAPGACRGNHAHPERDERVIVLSGSLVARDPESGSETEVSSDPPCMLVIPPGAAHALENRGSCTAVAICFSAAFVEGARRGDSTSGSVSLL
jgi:dTDP-4-dehydrorhamnose 3,5-epimerase-like enzyme